MKRRIIWSSAAILGAALLLGGCDWLDEEIVDDGEIEIIQSKETPEVDSVVIAPPGEVDDIVVIDTDGNVIGSGETSDSPEQQPVVGDGSEQGYFTTVDLDGNEVTQEIFTKSQITVLNKWGTFCQPCLREMPALGEIAAEYDSSEVQIIGAVCDGYSGNVSEIKSLVGELGANYTHLLVSESLSDWKLGEMQVIPSTLIVDSNGKILTSFTGGLSKDEWKKLIESYR